MRIYHECDLRKGRVSKAGQTYAISKDVYKKQRLLVADPDRPLEFAHRAEVVIGSLRWHHEQERIFCHAYTVMPDHLHIILAILGEWTLDRVMQALCGYTSQMLNQICNRTGKFWHKTYYDRRVRSAEELVRQLNYIWNNPVRAGYVQKPEDWPFSAIHPDW